jgi:hypothetical protein
MSCPRIQPASSIAASAVRSRSLLPDRSTSGENSPVHTSTRLTYSMFTALTLEWRYIKRLE